MNYNQEILYANGQVKAWQNRKHKTCGTAEMNPTLPTYFLHILQGQRWNAQVLTFALNSLRGQEFFIESCRRYHNLGAREKVSVFGVVLVRIFPHSDWIRRDCISPYSVRLRENTDQNNSEYGHILRSSIVAEGGLRKDFCSSRRWMLDLSI